MEKLVALVRISGIKGMKFNFFYGEVYKTRKGDLVTCTHESFILFGRVAKVFSDKEARYSNGRLYLEKRDPRDIVSGPISADKVTNDTTSRQAEKRELKMPSEQPKEKKPITVGCYVNCSYGLGFVRSIEKETNLAQVHIQSYGVRWIYIDNLTLHEQQVRIG